MSLTWLHLSRTLESKVLISPNLDEPTEVVNGNFYLTLCIIDTHVHPNQRPSGSRVKATVVSAQTADGGKTQR